MPKLTKACPYPVGDFVRLGVERSDPAQVSSMLDDPEALFLPVWHNKVLVTGEPLPCPVLLDRPDLAHYLPEPDQLEPILLGTWRSRPLLAVEPTSQPDASLGQLTPLRPLFPIITAEEMTFLGLALSLVQWRRASRFCGTCGRPTRPAEGGQMRACTNHECAKCRYPQTDPVVIMLVTRGDQALLVRQPGWPERMFALVAGFVEPSETLEQAAAREILEETGLVATNIRYAGSRHWPFPSQLMLGFTAEAATGELVMCETELETARFMTRQELRQAVQDDEIRLPTTHSLAYPLIENWYDAPGPHRLADLP